jgi:hypothetical protein
MAIRVTIDFPKPLYDQLRQLADNANTQVESLVSQAIESMLQKSEKRAYVTGPSSAARASAALDTQSTKIRGI